MNIFGSLIAYGKYLVHRYYGYALVLFIIICFTALLALNGCNGVNNEIVPAEPGVGYSWWAEAPGWVSKDFIHDGWGLIDGFSYQPAPEQKFHVLKIDRPDDGLDGECDSVVIVMESGFGTRKQGYSGPLVTVISTAECDEHEDIRRSVEIEG